MAYCSSETNSEGNYVPHNKFKEEMGCYNSGIKNMCEDDQLKRLEEKLDECTKEIKQLKYSINKT